MAVLDETFGMGPLEVLLGNSATNTIVIEGPKCISVENEGQRHRTCVAFRDEAHLVHILERIKTHSSCRFTGAIPSPGSDGYCILIRRDEANPHSLEVTLKS